MRVLKKYKYKSTVITHILIFLVLILSVLETAGTIRKSMSLKLPSSIGYLADGSFDLSGDNLHKLQKHIESSGNTPEYFILYKEHCLISTINTMVSRDEMKNISTATYLSNIDDKAYFSTEILATDKNGMKLVITKKIFKKQRRLFLAISFAFNFIILGFIVLCFIYFSNNEKRIRKSLDTLNEESRKISSGELKNKINQDSLGNSEINDILSSLEAIRVSINAHKENSRLSVMAMAHDLRTPVSVIKGYTEALSDQIITSKKEKDEALSIIDLKTAELESMISRLIDYEQIEESKYNSNMQDINLKNFINQFRNDFEPAITVFKRNININENISDNTSIRGNIALTQQMLENIFTNALRYTSSGDTITISVSESENDVEISISDTGVGIPEEHLDKIFNLFYRASPSRQEAGMGLGLAVAKEIADFHGWKITAKSKEGEGSIFSINIPKDTKENSSC